MVNNNGKQNEKVPHDLSQEKKKGLKKSSNSKNNMVYIFKITLGKSFASESFLKKSQRTTL